MITLWYPTNSDKHQVAGRLNKHRCLKGDSPTLGNIFEAVPDFYDEFKIKKIYHDTVDKSEVNLALIRASSISSNSTKWDWEDIKKWCDWCIEKDIRIALDDSWEFGSPFVNSQRGQFHRVKEYLIKNNIKIITNIPSLHHKFKWNTVRDSWFLPDKEKYYDKIYVNFDQFFYLTRYQHQTFNASFKMRTYPSISQTKKYLFSALVGDILKRRNTSLIGSLYYNNLINEDSFYTAINTDNKIPQELWLDNHNLPEIEDYVNKNKEKVFKHKPFELNYQNLEENDDPMIDERRIPQELYDSHFAVNVETMDQPFFFTEKTFKNILAKVPFITFGGSYFTAGLKEHHGFEMYDEIFDYSFENDIPENSKHGKYIQGIVDNIKRLKKEPVSIFYQPSVKEKLDYNEHIYYKNTTSIKIKESLEQLFLEVLQ